MQKHLTDGETSKSQCCKTLAELRAESYNEESGDLTGYDCPICKNKGMVAVIKDGEDVYRQCECLKIRHTNKLQSASGIHDLLDKYTFSGYMITEEWQKQALDKTIDFVDRESGWLYMSGRPGTGKTHLCTAAVGELLKKGIPCKYMLWRDEAVRLKGSVNDDTYSNLIYPLKTLRCLYIDDFLKGGITQGDINLAFEILNQRYNANLMTIISSEKSIREVLELDEAIGSRIYEKSREHIVEIKSGKNYRIGGTK